MSHTCHWPSCTEAVPPKLYACRKHWFKLPKSIQRKIWRCYVPGQEIRKDPTSEYLEVAAEANTWAKNYEKEYGLVPA